MDINKFYELQRKVIDAGFSEEIYWQQNAYCECADAFLWNYIWVVISSGMKNQVARIIEQRIVGIVEAYNNGESIGSAFNHKGKVAAIERMIEKHDDIYEDYEESDNKLQFLESLPYIGKITKYHLAKNLGEDVVKPDRHLVRIANQYKTTPDALCEGLACETGLRKATIDLIIWRAANLGFA